MIPDLHDMSSAHVRRTMNLALGRLFRMGARPEQPGDAKEFHRIRGIFMDGVDALEARGEWKTERVYQPHAATDLARHRQAGFSHD